MPPSLTEEHHLSVISLWFCGLLKSSADLQCDWSYITQSTFPKYFKCSQFSQFDSKWTGKIMGFTCNIYLFLYFFISLFLYFILSHDISGHIRGKVVAPIVFLIKEFFTENISIQASTLQKQARL